MLSIAAMAGAVSLPSSQRHVFFSLTFQICDPPTSTQPPPPLLCNGSLTKMVENPWLPLLIAPPNDHCQAPTITSTPKIKIHDNPIVNVQLPRPPPNARPLLNHAIDTEEFEGLADPRLEKNYVDSEMFRMIEAAAACVRHSATKRPRMGQVVRALDSMVAADLTNGMRVGESEIFNTAEQSAEIRLFRRMAFGSQDYSTDFFSQSSGSNTADSRQMQFRSGIL